MYTRLIEVHRFRVLLVNFILGYFVFRLDSFVRPMLHAAAKAMQQAAAYSLHVPTTMRLRFQW